MTTKQQPAQAGQQSGQAIILVAMAMLVLLASLGLALDGGGMFLMWRDAQNATDAAALQAAFAYCSSGNDQLAQAQNAGYNAATANGFDNVGVDNDSDGIVESGNRVVVDRAVSQGISVSGFPNPNAVLLTRIQAVKPAYFIQLVYGGPLSVTVETLGVCDPGSIFDGYGVFAMGNNGMCGYSDTNESSGSQYTHSGSEAHIWGSIFSNGNFDVDGANVYWYDDGTANYMNASDNNPAEDRDDDDLDTPGSTGNPGEDLGDPIDYTEFPVLYEIQWFAQPGKPLALENGGSLASSVWNEVMALDLDNTGTPDALEGSPWAVHYNSTPTLNTVVEGLIVSEGGIDFGNGFGVGPRGVTLVARDVIKVTGNAVGGSPGSPVIWQPFTAAEGTDSLAMFTIHSTFNVEFTDANCSTSTGNAGIRWSASNIAMFGTFYAPYSTISYSVANAINCGSIIALAVDGSWSTAWIFGTAIPGVDVLSHPSIDVPTYYHQFAGRSCDFIDNEAPSYHLASP